MTQTSIDFSAPVEATPRTGKVSATYIVNERLAAYFRAHPNEDVSAFTIIGITEQPLAFRTRISELRYGPWFMAIGWKPRPLANGKRASFYRYVPADEKTAAA